MRIGDNRSRLLDGIILSCIYTRASRVHKTTHGLELVTNTACLTHECQERRQAYLRCIIAYSSADSRMAQGFRGPDVYRQSHYEDDCRLRKYCSS